MDEHDIELQRHSLPLSENSYIVEKNAPSIQDDKSTRHNSNTLDVEKDVLPDLVSYQDYTIPSPDNIQQLEHLYLTFDTELPNPAVNMLSQQSRNNLPPQPDLSKFINPLEWSSSRKSFILWMSCIATCFTAFSAGAYSPGSKQMQKEWKVGHVAILVGITTFTM